MSIKKMLLPLLLVVMLSLAACSSNSDNGGVGTDANQNNTGGGEDKNSQGTVVGDPFSPFEDQISFTIGRQGVAGNNLPSGDTLEDNDFLRYVEERLNIKIDYAFSVEDGDGYTQRVNLAIAGTNIPDVMLVGESQFRRLVEADMLEDLSDAYETYASDLIRDYYNSFGDIVLDAVTFDGELLALPDTILAGNNQFLWVREDWLKELNHEVPETLEDIVNVTKAFKENNMGGANTVGLLGDVNLYTSGGFFTFDPIFAAHHSYPGLWIKNDEGEVINGSIAPETKEALGVLRQMYLDEIIDKEFVARKWDDNAALVASGQSGILFAPWFAGWMLSDAVANDNNADWIPISAPLDSAGKFNVADSAPSGMYLVVKKGFEHPEAIVKALNVQYEGLRLRDPNAVSIYEGLGVSWLNYPFNLQLNYKDAVLREAIALDEALANGDASSLPESQIPRYESIVFDNENPKEDMAHYANKLAFYTGALELGSDAVDEVTPVFFGQTPAMSTKGAQLEKLEEEAFLKIITGVEPLDHFDEFVREWKRLGGDEITEEVIAEVNSN